MSESLFWNLAAEMESADPNVVEGTIMGSPCLRVDGEFLAMPHRRSGALVVKLPRERVTQLIEQGIGEPFAPGGRIFREWLTVEEADEDHWRELLDEGKAFVTP